jgi:hypothetical protein
METIPDNGLLTGFIKFVDYQPDIWRGPRVSWRYWYEEVCLVEEGNLTANVSK